MKKVELVRLSRITRKLCTFQDGGYKYMACTTLTCKWGGHVPCVPPGSDAPVPKIPRLGVRNANPKLQSLLSQEQVKLPT